MEKADEKVPFSELSAIGTLLGWELNTSQNTDKTWYFIPKARCSLVKEPNGTISIFTSRDPHPIPTIAHEKILTYGMLERIQRYLHNEDTHSETDIHRGI